MKKSLSTLIVVAVAILVLPNMASALTVPGMMNKIKQAAWDIFLGLAIISIIVSAIMFLTAAGNPEKLSKAKAAFVWSIAGIAVGLAAAGLYSIIEDVVSS